MPATPLPPAPPAPPIASPANPLQYDSLNKTTRDACKRRLMQLHVEEGVKIMEIPTAPGSCGRPISVQTNIFGLELMKDTTVYCYVIHISAILGNEKEVVFTKKGVEDFVVLDRHEKCSEILKYIVDANPEFFWLEKGCDIIYDGQSCLFTTHDILTNVPVESKKRNHVFEIDGAKMQNKDLHELHNIKVEIYSADRQKIVLSRENLLTRTADPNLEQNDRSLEQFVDLVLNQSFLFDSYRFACFGGGKVFILRPSDSENQRFKQVGDGKALIPGIRKTINFIEGPNGRNNNNPSLVVDAIVAAFHLEQPLIDKVVAICNPKSSGGLMATDVDKASKVIKGLDCYSNYMGKVRHLQVTGIHRETALSAKFAKSDESQITVADYFAEKYKIHLKYPNFNLAIAKYRGNSNFYPMELLMVSPNQRVSINQLTSAQSQLTTKECAVVPTKRQGLIMSGMNSGGLFSKHSVCSNLGIKLYDNPLICSGRELGGVRLNYEAPVRSEQGKWRIPKNSKFIKPASFNVWACYGVQDRNNSRFNSRDLSDFVKLFYNNCCQKGMRIPQPTEVDMISHADFDDKMATLAKYKCEYVLFITDDSIKNIHSMMKYLERKYEVTTQDMRMSVASSIVRDKRYLSLDNVLSKTNMKMGGLNYSIINDILSNDQLIIGICSSQNEGGGGGGSHTSAYLDPTAIGYSCNGKSKDEFIGDFIFTLSHINDAYDCTEEIIKNCAEKYLKTNNGAPPKRVIIYRSNPSEGNFSSILAFEIPLVKETLKQMGCESTKLIYIVVSKQHSVRLFKTNINPRDRANDQNIPPGVVVDSEITHPSYKQFYLNSHTTIQGSAKTPCYTVVYDDCKTTMDKLEDLTYSLCHHHQIVSMSTSLPSPMYIASEYAKRGRTVWTSKTSSQVPSKSYDNDLEVLRKLNLELSYKSSIFNDRRVNA